MSMEKNTFEEEMTRLDEILASLNDSDLPLERSAALYKEGLSLYQKLSEMLDKAEGETALLYPELDGTFQKESFSFKTEEEV